MQGKHSGLNEALSETSDFLTSQKDDPDAIFLLKITPYLEKLGIPVPKIPDIPSILEASLKAMLPNTNMFSNSDKLAESMAADTKTKAFAAHQILGFMQEHGKITEKECITGRKEIFEGAINTVNFIDEFKEPLNTTGQYLDKAKNTYNEFIETFVESTARQEIKKSLLESDQQEHATEEKHSSSSRERSSEKQSSPEQKKQRPQNEKTDTGNIWNNIKKMGLNAITAVETASSINKISDIFSNNKFDIGKHDSYIENIDNYIAQKKEMKNLKRASGALKIARENDVDALVNKVSNDDLSDSLVDKIISSTGKKLDKTIDFFVATALYSDLHDIKKELVNRTQEVNTKIQELNRSEHCNINELQDYHNFLSQQNPRELLVALDDLKLKAKGDGCHTVEFYDDIQLQKDDLAKLIGRYEKLDKDVVSISANLVELKSKVEQYESERQDSPLKDWWAEKKDYQPESGKTKDVKLNAAGHLKEEIQTGAQNYGLYEDKALEDGDLAKMKDSFTNYKEQFQKNIKDIDEEFSQSKKSNDSSGSFGM